MPLERDGLAYIARGFAVIPLYFPNKDGSCSCKKGASCTSPGKHPVGMVNGQPIAPNGVDDATRDVATVARWFQSDIARLNLGVACGPVANGRNLVVFDIDSTEVAHAVLDPEIGVMDATATAGTGKGCHIYLYTDANVQTHTLYLNGRDHKTGKVGEIRSTGAYVAAPPSKHYSGVRYRWFGQPEDDHTIPDIMTVANIDKYAAHLCARAGFPLEPPDLSGANVPELEGAIQAIELPFKYNPSENHDTQRLWMLTHPQGIRRNKDEGGRSVDLYEIGHVIVRVASANEAVLDADQIMGILKQIDAGSFGKYTNRRDGDKRYHDMVVGKKGCLRRKDGTLMDSTQYFIDHPTTRPVGKYGWDADRSMTVLYGQKSDIDLCNFQPVIEEELEIDSGDGEILRAYKATFSQPTGSVALQLLPEHLEGERSLRRKFYEECPVTYNVYPEGWRHLPSILREGSKDAPKHRIYRHTGWIDTPDGRAFVLQGSGGAITADSINHELAYEEDPRDNINPKLHLYGVGVRPTVTERDVLRAEKALNTLVKSASPAIVIPIIAQVIAGPLTSHGADQDPSLVHVTGKTGSMKTSLATACLSIFGMFDRSNVPESWMSTVASLQALLYYVKDLTLMIDDYKIGTAGRVAALIQQYSDRTTRSRMASDQHMRRRMHPRGLMLSTGEDMWEDQESTMARTIIVDMTREDVHTRYLTQMQEKYIPEGWLQLVGGGYLAWLAEFTSEELNELYADIRRSKLKFMQESMSSAIHGRLVGVLASLITASYVFERYLKARLPGAYGTYKAASKDAWAARSAALAQQGEEAREHSPYAQVINELRSCIRTKEWRIVDLYDNNQAHGGGLSAPIVGYFDEKYVYIGRSTTWQQFSKRRQQRGEPAAFTWRSVLKDARATVKGVQETQLWALGNARIVRLPESELQLSGAPVDANLADFINQAPSEGEA